MFSFNLNISTCFDVFWQGTNVATTNENLAASGVLQNLQRLPYLADSQVIRKSWLHHGTAAVDFLSRIRPEAFCGSHHEDQWWHPWKVPMQNLPSRSEQSHTNQKGDPVCNLWSNRYHSWRIHSAPAWGNFSWDELSGRKWHKMTIISLTIINHKHS